MRFNFTPATPEEQIVYGARRPEHPRLGHSNESVHDWVSFVKEHGIEGVCCLLDDSQLREYDDLLGIYRAAFGAESVLHAPVPDFSTVNESTFCDQILPALDEADWSKEPIVVHCSAGSGRTGHILALWVHLRRGYGLKEAVKAIKDTGRNPLEATTLSQLERIRCDS